MLRSGFFLFLGLLLGRGLGLFRELLLAGNVGTGNTADIIVALITLPDIAISILLGNSLAAVFIPTIKSLDPSKRFGYFLKLSAWLGAFFFLISFLTVFNVNVIGKIILPSSQNSPEFLHELSWVIWAVPVLALNAVSRVFLQAENRFTLLGMENVLFNICIILGILLFTKNPSLHLISLTVLIGAVFRWALQFIQIWTLYSKNLTGYKTPIQLSDLHRYNLALVTGLMVQLLPIYGRSITSSFEREGALAIYNYAYKFIEFPMALGISVISTLIFPKLTEIAVGGSKRGHSDLIQKSQSLIITLCLPATILVPILLFYLAKKPFPLKQIPAEDLSKIFISIAIGFFAFFIRGLNELYIVILNSLGDVKHPMYSTLIASTVGLVTIYFLTQAFGIYGSFWGLNLSFLVAFLLNIWFLKKKHQVEVLPAILTQSNLKTLFMAFLIGAVFFFVSQYQDVTITVACWTILTLGIYVGTIGRQVLSRMKK